MKMIVQVDGRWAYMWEGPERPAVGDRVLLPANWLSEIKRGPGPFEGVVTEVNYRTDYDGPLSTIIRRLDGAPGD
jgi:hypothetical protein